MSVSSPVIDSIDGPNRKIHLRSGVTSYHPVDDIYKEVRNLRRTDESLRGFEMFCSAIPLFDKGGGRFTPRGLVLLSGCRIVPFNEDSVINVTGEQLTDEGGTGSDCMDLSSLSSDIIINYEPPDTELIVTTSSGSIPSSVATEETLEEVKILVQKILDAPYVE